MKFLNTKEQIFKYKKEMILSPLFKIIEVLVELALPFFVASIINTGLFYDDAGAIVGGDAYFIVTRCLAMFGLIVFSFCTTMVCQYLSSKASSSLGYDLRNSIIQHYLLMDKKEISNYSEGKIITLINNDTDSFAKGFCLALRMLIRWPVLLLGSIICAFIINIYAGCIFLGVLVLTSSVIVLTIMYQTKKYLKVQDTVDKMNVKGGDSIQGIRVIKAFNKEVDEQKSFSILTSKYQKDSVSAVIIGALNTPLSYLLINLSICLILYFVGNSFSLFSLNKGELTSLISYLTQALLSLVFVINLVITLTKGFASLKRIECFLSISPTINNAGMVDKIDIKVNEPIIAYHNVSFGFSKNSQILNNLEFFINKGETVGIIGGTGSGKSLIIELLERFYDPTSGEIIYKGKNIKNYSLTALRDEISLVNQKYSLLKGTIKDNIVMNNEYSNEQIVKALKEAKADFVFDYNDSINHEVKENGSNFSGGQKQRLNIARALLKAKDVLILDDSMSSLDYLTDKEIRENIHEHLNKEITTIIISQRASSLTNCDKIIVLDKGKIVDIGTNKELLDSCSLYKEIYDTQVAKI